MKYLSALIIACLPLLALAGSSVVDLLRVPAETAAEIKPIDVSAAEKIATATSESARKNEPVIKALAVADLFDVSPKDPLSATGLEGFPDLLERWKYSKQTRAWIAEYADAGLPDKKGLADGMTDVEALAKMARDLQLFISRQEKLPAGEPLRANVAPALAMLDSRRMELEATRTRILGQKQVEDGLREARDALKMDQPAKCLTVLARDYLRDSTDSVVRKECEALLVRAEYRVAATALLNPIGAARPLTLGDYDRFLKEHANYPDGEEKTDEALRRTRAKLNLKNKLAEIATIADFEKILSKGKEILQDELLADDATELERVKGELRDALRKWLKVSGMPKVPVPTLLEDKLEIVLKGNNERRIGVFHLPKDVDTWRYWKTPADRENDKFGERAERLPKSLFDGKSPDEPTYLRLARSYNRLVDSLFTRIDSKDSFEKFAENCETLNKELSAYKASFRDDKKSSEFDIACIAFDFNSPAAAARQVVENWDDFQKIVD